MRKWRSETLPASGPISPRQRVLTDINVFNEQKRKKHILMGQIETLNDTGTENHEEGAEQGEETESSERSKQGIVKVRSASFASTLPPPKLEIFDGLNSWNTKAVCDWFVGLKWGLGKQQQDEYLSIFTSNDIDGQVCLWPGKDSMC